MRRLALSTCCYCTSGGGRVSACGGLGGGGAGLDAEIVRRGDRVVGADHRKARDLDRVGVGEVASVRPRLVVGGDEASVDVESGLAAPASESLDLRPRRARGEQTASALDAAAVRAVAPGAIGADADDEDAV